MQVYIEYVIFDNLLINTLIILLTSKTLSVKLNKINVFISVVIGTGFAVLMPLIYINSALLFVCKIAVGFAMVAILKKYNSFKDYILYFLVFLTFTFVMGGSCFAILIMLNQNVSLNQILLFGYNFPVGIFLFVFVAYIYLLIKAITISKSKIKHNRQIIDFIITHNNKSYNVKGFLDTGNQLYENGQAVVVVSQKMFLKIFKNITYTQLFLNKLNNLGLKNLSYLNVGAISGTKKMPVINLDNFLINKKQYNNVRVAISYSNFGADFDCILHPDIF